MRRTVGDSLGERLRFLRELRGWKQDQIADVMGVSRAAVSLYEADRSEPRWHAISRLLDSLGVPYWVFTRAESEIDWNDIQRTMLQKQLDDLLLGSPTETPFDAHNTNGDGAHSTNRDAGQERENSTRARHILGVRGALAGVGA